jgi:large subunit ribosomal protein L35
MSKLKTVKGVKARVKITGTGKAVAFRPGRRHLLSHRRAKTKRHLRRPRVIASVETRKLRALVPYA